MRSVRNPILAVGAVAVLLCGAVWGAWIWRFGTSPPARKYGAVVASVASGALPVPADGVVKLPPKWAGLTARGTVNVELRPDGRRFILFPTWHGRGDDVEGWLYCSGPLTPADFYTVDWGAGGKARHLDACGYRMLTVEARRPPWYAVSRRLD